ncbi:MAG: hypothetical protein ACBR15_03550 [Microcoleus sp.]
MNSDFFDKLYRGYSAENFITAQLFEYGFEAFRLPADFGIDLVATNQFKKLKSKKNYDNSFPFGFQVKSFRLQQRHTLKGPNDRKEYQFFYSITRENLETLQEYPNSALAFVFMIPFGYSIKNIYVFCIHSTEIDNMIEKQFFIEDFNSKKPSYNLNVCFRTFPHENRENLISEMVNKNLIDQYGVKFLKDKLPEHFPKNWKAKEGLYLCRKHYGKNPPNSLVNRAIVTNYDFSKFPDFPKISYT